MNKTTYEADLRGKYFALQNELDERGRRRWAALEARSLGQGGIAILSRATGLSRNTINQGFRDLEEHRVEPKRRQVRRSGGGRKRLSKVYREICVLIEQIVDPTSRGHPETPLRWTCKSTRNIAKELCSKGHEISHATVAELLRELGYSLQAPRKRFEGKQSPDRNAQFGHINRTVKEFQDRGEPVVSVDCKKKENIGRKKNVGEEWQKEGQPEEVDAYDFRDKKKGIGIPYGIYDQTRNNGWVSVGTDHETSKFAVETLKRWWESMGKKSYPNARELLITADGGGANGSRRRAWKKELQEFTTKTNLKIKVCHFPPGTSKWNKIEHRMFSQITRNWRAQCLESHEVMVNLIANTRTETGLEIKARLDDGKYELGQKVTKAEMKLLNLTPDEFHGEWNYMISPKEPQNAQTGTPQ